MLVYVCVSADSLCDMGMVQQLAGMLHSPHSHFHEHLVRALLALATDHQRAAHECSSSELQLGPVLVDKINTLQGQDDCQVVELNTS